MKHVKNTVFVLLLTLLIFPAIQKKVKLITSKDLNGVYSLIEKPTFTVSGWFKGSYQEQFRQHIEDFPGFKSDYVRLYNQLDYSFFSIPHARKFMVGKQGYLYGTEYISSYQGANFIGKRYCHEKVRLLKILQDRLWKEKKIFLLVIFAPDKATFFPENIPSRFLKKKTANTNYDYYSKLCREAGINFIDFNRYFKMAKDTSRYPLYPKTGIHWSSYGAEKAADSLIRYLKIETGYPMPELVVDKTEISHEARDEDADIEKTMNLIWKIRHPVYAYPQFHFKSDTARQKPNGLVIGDSFYWTWYNPGIIKNIFSNVEFWYYGKDVYPQTFTKPMNIGELNFLETVNRQNIIIFLQTNAGYGNLGYDFIDRLYAELEPSHSQIIFYENQIRNSKTWLDNIQKSAEEQHLPLDEVIREAAIYMVNQGLSDKKH
jgi:SGNH hydrolase-like domain, acetyltransferase AlgX